jgi:alanyl-tRNA synthetase
MTSNEIRSKYLEFFKSRGHAVVPSASLTPENDPTTLFTGSGMQPLIPYLLGQKHPLGTRVVNSQKCFRAEDIDEVGDNRHTTFFEMLGNWSFGDYWKEEQLPWFFEFLTKEVGIPKDRLWVTCFDGDKESGIPRDTDSAEIWKGLGIPQERIRFYGAKKNWWSRAGVPANMPAGEPGGPDSEVFYEFAQIKHDPAFGKECHPNCDCGRFMEIGNSVFMEYVKTEKGFEKLKQRNVDFGGGLERIAAAAQNDPDIFKIDLLKPLVDMLPTIMPTRVKRIMADHARAATFLISDGVRPSNKDRGYMLRRLMRRMVVHEVKGGKGTWKESNILSLIRDVVSSYNDAYPELNASVATEEFGKEYQKFNATLQQGLRELQKLETIDAPAAFKLFETFGVPYEVIKDPEISGERANSLTRSAFDEEFKKHRDLSRTTSAGVFKGGLADHSDKVVRYHTATHLMHSALRKVLGEHVIQTGSNITSERTRFDFKHTAKMTEEEKKKVEDLVNEWIQRDYQVKREFMPLQEAFDLGAIGAFGEKYAETVSVYTVWDPKTKEVVSREFCGGPHVEHTRVIGAFRLGKEEAVSAGVRRIRATIEP